MAGVAGFPFKPVLSRTVSTPSSSNPCTCRAHLIFKNPNPFGLNGCRSSVSLSSRPVAVTARYGGFRPGQSDSRRSRESRKVDFGADPALDMSTISSPSVRLIDGQQNMVGVVSKSEAIRMAEEAELDLVILSPDADPPVVKIMDYNKYRYEQQKKKRDQQKKSTATRMDMKELKMGFNIDSHDYSVRLRAAKKFLKDGDKVKIIVSLKGRENEFRNIAVELIKRFQNDVGELATEESKSFSERNIFIVLIPNKTVQQKAAPGPSKKKEQSVSEVSAL